MDPEVAWLALVEAIQQEDLAEAAVIAADLKNWLTRGGFPPSVSQQLKRADGDSLSLAVQLQRELALQACNFILLVS